MSRIVYRHTPFWILGIGILLTWFLAVAFTYPHANPWQIGGVVVLAVGAPNALLIVYFRRHHRLVREAAIAEVREMMADRVKNQLAVIGMYAPLTQEQGGSALAIDGINASMTEISRVVDGLSSESLGSWKAHYQNALDNGALSSGPAS